jgi:DNA mismatch repair protein MutS
MFFNRSTPLKPINLSFDETMTKDNCIVISDKLCNYNRPVLGENIVDLSKTYDDLELFQSADAQSIFDAIDNTETFIGSIYLEKILDSPTTNLEELKERQRICKALLSEKKNFSEICDTLVKINKYEKALLWALKEKTNEEQRILSTIFFKHRLLKHLNLNETFMTFYNYFKIIFAPFYGILSPVIFIILPFIYLKYFTGLDINFNEYWRIFRTTLLGGGGSFPNTNEILHGLRTARTPQQINQTLRSASMRSNRRNLSKMFQSFLTLIFYIQNVLNAVEVSKRTHETINAIHSKLNDISEYYSLAYKLDELTRTYFNKSPFEQFLPQLANPLFKSTPSIFSNKGLILGTYLGISKDNNLTELLNYVGEVDYFVSCCKLINKTGGGKYCFTEFIKAEDPYIQCKNIWHPLINDEKVVTNDITLGEPRNMIITGPNAGGKSTFIKSITLSLILSQTLGISLGTNMKMTPFKLINTYLNIPDISGKESLFEAEMNRAREHIDKLEKMDKQDFSFFIMDEIFSSTNPEEGISGGFAVCERLGELKNSINIITTHFNYLTNLTESGNYKAYKIPIGRNDNGDIVYNYKLEPGVSDQFIALELLKTKGFDKNIVARAQEVCKKIGKEKVAPTVVDGKLEKPNTKPKAKPKAKKIKKKTEKEKEPEKEPEPASALTAE